MFSLFKVNQHNKTMGIEKRSAIVRFGVGMKRPNMKGETTIVNDLNQTAYDYTAEVTNRFKGLDLIDRVPENYGWRFVTLHRRQ